MKQLWVKRLAVQRHVPELTRHRKTRRLEPRLLLCEFKHLGEENMKSNSWWSRVNAVAARWGAAHSRACGLLFLLIVLGVACSGQTLYSDFEAGSGFSTNSWCVTTVAATGCGTPINEFIAASFTPTVSATLSSITLALGIISGPNQVAVALFSNGSGGVPGSPIEIWSPQVFSSYGGIITPTTVVDTQHVALQAGTTYWVVVEPYAQTTSAAWYTNSLGLGGGLYSVNDGATWASLGSGQTQPAFSVTGASTAPTALTISSITPNPITVNSPATRLTIQGTGLQGTSAYFCPSPAPTVSWNGTLLTITSSSATQVVATVPASLLTTIGTYPVTVTVTSSTDGVYCSNRSASGSVQVVASSTGGGGSLGVSTANVSFSDAGGVASGSQTFSVTSSSGSISYGINTTYNNSASCANWITLSRTSGTASPGSPSSVTASLNGAVLSCPTGQFTATLTVTGGTTGSAIGPRGSTSATILVTLNKSPTNGITVQTTMVFGALTGALAPFSSPQDSQILQVNTVTGANLQYAYAIAPDQQGSVLPCSAAQTAVPTPQTSQTPQWLMVSPAYVMGSALTAPGVLTVSVQPQGLAPGTYVDDINQGDQYGNNATVRVYLVVASTATNEYSFSYVSGGSQPAAQGFGPFADNCPSSAANIQIGASSDQGWLGVSANAVSLSPTASFMITATPSPSMSPGMYYGTVILTDTDGQAVLISCTLTVAAAPTQQTSVLPQIAFDGGWYSALYFTNVTSTAAAFPVNFVSDAGMPLNVPSGSSTQVNPAANGTAIIEAPDAGGTTVNQGYAEFALPSGVQGYGVFRQAGQEAVVPFSQGNATSNTLTFDDTGPLVTSVAIVNPSSVPATVVITLWNAAGTIIGSSSVALGPNSKTEKELRLLPGLSGMVGNRGTAQFAVSSGSVAVLGLRFNGAAFTSIPTTNP